MKVFNQAGNVFSFWCVLQYVRWVEFTLEFAKGVANGTELGGGRGERWGEDAVTDIWE